MLFYAAGDRNPPMSIVLLENPVRAKRPSGAAFPLGSCGFEGVGKNGVDLSDAPAAVALELGPELVVGGEPGIGLQHLGGAGPRGKDAGNHGVLEGPDDASDLAGAGRRGNGLLRHV